MTLIDEIYTKAYWDLNFIAYLPYPKKADDTRRKNLIHPDSGEIIGSYRPDYYHAKDQTLWDNFPYDETIQFKRDYEAALAKGWHTELISQYVVERDNGEDDDGWEYVYIVLSPTQEPAPGKTFDELIEEFPSFEEYQNELKMMKFIASKANLDE